jgi:hypothetical protein
MKVRNGFISNSSSSSFVVLKESLTEQQQDMLIDYVEWIKFLFTLDSDEDLESKFSNYDSDPWRIQVYDDFIFGETSMDNFSMNDYLDYIKVNNDYIEWDEGYNDEPYPAQLAFILRKKQEYRKKKLDKLNNV